MTQSELCARASSPPHRCRRPKPSPSPPRECRCFLIACARFIAGPVPIVTGGSQSP